MSEAMHNFDRRTFLKGGLMAGAAAAAGSMLAACAPQAPGSSSDGQAVKQDVEDITNETEGVGQVSPGYNNPDKIAIVVEPDATEDVDVVVIGSGMGGFAASMVTKEQASSAHVVMLEKLSTLGGNTNFAEGGGGFLNTPADEAIKAVQAEVIQRNFVVDPSLFYQLKVEQGDCADWLFGKHGVKVKDYGTGQPLYEGGTGASMIATLTPQAEELGIDIRTESRAVALVMQDEYTVVGVQYRDKNDKVTQLNAKAVVIATGGMNTNPDLLKLYSNVDLGKIMPLGTGQDGDGHLMAEQTAHGRTGLQTIDGFFAGIGTAEDPCGFDSDLNTAAGFQFSDCFVNEYGNRFYDESFSFNTGSQLFFTCIPQMVLSQSQAYSIFDASYVKRWEEGDWQNGHNGFDSATKHGEPLTVQPEIERVSGSDWFHTADTIEDLGKALAEVVPTFDVENFVATIEAYNAASEGLQPDEFGKPKDFVWALKTPPFYAAKLGVNAYNTNGGIHINKYAQVIDPNGKPISGLYASGIATHGWDSQVYGGGTNQPVALWCSCAAARHLVVNQLGGSVAADWMGDVPMTSILGADYSNGNPLDQEKQTAN